MRLYSENESYKLYQGNMLDMLEVIEPNSIDSIITDPPYGLTSITKRFGKEDSAECKYGKDGSFQRLSKGFMGKEWDGSGVEYNIDTWKKCFEVLKPGGYLLAFGGSRTFHRIACAIEDAGFEIRDTIMWLYGSGFPKSMDISKAIDKRNGRNYNDDFKTYINNKRLEKNISFKTINEKLGVSTTGGGMASNIFGGKQETNNVLPTKNQYKILKDLLELDDRFDNLIFLEEAEREVIGQKKSSLGGTVAAGERNEYFIKEHKNKMVDITIPSTDLAKQWQGWGTALKPSFEPIIVARKPFKGNLVDNVIEYGVGGINIDECRVEAIDKEELQKNWTNRKAPAGFNGDKSGIYGSGKTDNTIAYTPSGRFPANTILTYDETDFEEVCGGFPITNGGKRHNSHVSLGNNISYGFEKGKDIIRNEFNDSGSASRYFYAAKASKKDRDEGLDIEESVITDGRKKPIDNAFNRGETLRKNTHPTVKPTTLMQYLVRLVTPNNGTILDPFNGSGSTGKAVMCENKERNKNYKYIGIELTEEYLPISKARIEYVCNLEDKKESQLTIFDLENNNE